MKDSHGGHRGKVYTCGSSGEHIRQPAKKSAADMNKHSTNNMVVSNEI